MMNAQLISLPLDEITHARLPVRYTAAKAALEECNRVDECLAWANKMHALASYARQAKDESLKNMAMRVQARAVRRCGMLLNQVQGQGGRRTDRGIQGPPTRLEVARSAGLSRGQMRQAIQVAQVPSKEFETVVETTPPPTTTALAVRGVRSRKKLSRVRIRKSTPPKGVQVTLDLMRQLTMHTNKVSAEHVANFLFDHGHRSFIVQEQVEQLLSWLNHLQTAMGGNDAS